MFRYKLPLRALATKMFWQTVLKFWARFFIKSFPESVQKSYFVVQQRFHRALLGWQDAQT